MHNQSKVNRQAKKERSDEASLAVGRISARQEVRNEGSTKMVATGISNLKPVKKAMV